MTLESAVAFFAAILIFAVTPGPGVFALIARGLSQGARKCIMLALGMTISDILYLIAACFGLAALATHWGELFTVIRYVGAAYLIYLGWKMWTAPAVIDQADIREDRKAAAMGFVQGFLISASNPKVILFYIAFLPTFMDVTVLDNADIVLASVITFVALMIGLMAIAYSASRARKLFKSEKAVKRLNRGAGSIMVGAGVFLAAKSS